MGAFLVSKSTSCTSASTAVVVLHTRISHVWMFVSGVAEMGEGQARTGRVVVGTNRPPLWSSCESGVHESGVASECTANRPNHR